MARCLRPFNSSCFSSPFVFSLSGSSFTPGDTKTPRLSAGGRGEIIFREQTCFFLIIWFKAGYFSWFSNGNTTVKSNFGCSTPRLVTKRSTYIYNLKRVEHGGTWNKTSAWELQENSPQSDGLLSDGTFVVSTSHDGGIDGSSSCFGTSSSWLQAIFRVLWFPMFYNIIYIYMHFLVVSRCFNLMSYFKLYTSTMKHTARPPAFSESQAPHRNAACDTVSCPKVCLGRLPREMFLVVGIDTINPHDIQRKLDANNRFACLELFRHI